MAERAGAVRRNAVLYRHLLGARVRSDLQYRASFAMVFAATLLVSVVDFAMIAVIFGRIDALAGWSLAETAFLFGLSGISFGLASLVVSPVERAGERIRSGSFDILLLRPVGTVLQLVTDEFALRRVARVVQPLAVLVVAMAALDLPWTPLRLAGIAGTITAGAVIFGAIWVLCAATMFWTVEGSDAANAVTYGGGFLTQYPLPVYGDVVRALAFVVPLAFVNYMPAVAILDKHDPLGLPPALRYASPLVAAALVAVATVAWGLAVRHYRSTGS